MRNSESQCLAIFGDHKALRFNGDKTFELHLLNHIEIST